MPKANYDFGTRDIPFGRKKREKSSTTLLPGLLGGGSGVLWAERVGAWAGLQGERESR